MDGVVLFAQLEEVVNLQSTFLHGTRMQLASISAETGEVLWRRTCANWAHGSPPDFFVIDDTVWTFSEDGFTALGLDPVSGEIKKKVPVDKAMDIGHHHRCYQNRATTRYLLSSRRGVEFVDVKNGDISLNHWIRGMCRVGVLPSNGLLYVPPDACGCYTKAKVTGFNALAGGSLPKYAPHPPIKDTRLERGPAYGQIENRKSEIKNPNDWPTYRHDGLRSGSTAGSIPDQLTVRWKAKVESRPSAVTVAGGNVFLAAVDRHDVIALDAETGEQLWSFAAGGRVDSPPTIYKGMALVGCRNGWVYCLRARDGALAWRFRAAPEERRIIAFNQLESAWRVHGSVLVREGVAYFVAGRSSFLDGGMHVYALDPLNGSVVMNRCVYSPDPETGEMHSDLSAQPSNRKSVTHHMPGALPDILVSDGTSVCMRHLKLDPKTLESTDGPGELPAHQGLAATAGLLDDSMFHRSHWGIDGAGGKGTWCELLVFRGSAVYRIDAHGRHGWKQHGIHRPGSGYVVSAYDRKEKKEIWKQKIPVRAVSMVLAGDRLYLAGSPDVKEAEDPWASLLGKRGGRLLVLAAEDGKKLCEYDLEAPPVWDGMAVAAGRLYISTCNGEIVCMGGK
ncbi:MAG: PQQ-binding-like beta-propeller repeat protein [Planctomycetes bacterium]|nr:PQQ-binding-like beta-propeller repeat protein [Planctomycetota bacterium]